eukprot:SAG25_NODE_613_length_6536_cov_28.178033_8_plen_86_part_00
MWCPWCLIDSPVSLTSGVARGRGHHTMRRSHGSLVHPLPSWDWNHHPLYNFFCLYMRHPNQLHEMITIKECLTQYDSASIMALFN